jgi:prevent-host-death family protein
MPLVGVRELRERTSEVLRQVREEGVEYVITYQGRPIAMLLPVDAETYAQLAEQVRQAWPAEQSTQDLLDEIRR